MSSNISIDYKQRLICDNNLESIEKSIPDQEQLANIKGLIQQKIRTSIDKFEEKANGLNEKCFSYAKQTADRLIIGEIVSPAEANNLKFLADTAKHISENLFLDKLKKLMELNKYFYLGSQNHDKVSIEFLSLIEKIRKEKQPFNGKHPLITEEIAQDDTLQYTLATPDDNISVEKNIIVSGKNRMLQFFQSKIMTSIDKFDETTNELNEKCFSYAKQIADRLIARETVFPAEAANLRFLADTAKHISEDLFLDKLKKLMELIRDFSLISQSYDKISIELLR